MFGFRVTPTKSVSLLELCKDNLEMVSPAVFQVDDVHSDSRSYSNVTRISKQCPDSKIPIPTFSTRVRVRKS